MSLPDASAEVLNRHQSSTRHHPPIIRPIDSRGQVSAAIPPETLLSSEEQEVIRRFRVQKRQSERGTDNSGDLFERPSHTSHHTSRNGTQVNDILDVTEMDHV